MNEIWARISQDVGGRLHGPLRFRLIIQPLMAVMFAVIDGVRDAKRGQPPYFWAFLFRPELRNQLGKDTWKHAGKIFLAAVVLDIAYQIKVIHRIYPGELLIVALSLAILPYVLLRGTVTRIVRTIANLGSTQRKKSV